MEQSNEYNPISCDHKLPNGFTAWQFQSEEQSNLNGELNKVAIYVCIKCGEISVGGYRTGADGSHNSFDEHFNIHYPDAIDAIIKQANFFNEEAKWCGVDDYASLRAKCTELISIYEALEGRSLAALQKAIYHLKKALSAGEGEKEEMYICPCCKGDGKETCTNPDHGFIDAMGGEIQRLGCPVCGHDPNHKVKNGGKCDTCDGSGKVNIEQFNSFCDETGYDNDPVPANQKETKP